MPWGGPSRLPPLVTDVTGAQVLRMHLLDNLRQRIEAGHKDFLNELRACTVVFVGLPSLQEHRPGATADGAAAVQAAVDVVQRRLVAAGGSFLQARLGSLLLLSLHTPLLAPPCLLLPACGVRTPEAGMLGVATHVRFVILNANCNIEC